MMREELAATCRDLRLSNMDAPSCLASPTDRSIGNVDPSLRWPITSRPIPIILRSPVSRKFRIPTPAAAAMCRNRA